MSAQLFTDSIRWGCVLHEVNNLSDHDPVCLCLDLSIARLSYDKRKFTARPSWFRAKSVHIDHYKSVLQSVLNKIVIPHDLCLCHDVHCCKADHVASLDEYVAQLTDACLKSAEVAIHFTRPSGYNGCIPGWSEVVAPLRDQSLFWHNLWSDCGRPHQGLVADIMRKIRARYHREVRYVKKNKDDIVNK